MKLYQYTLMDFKYDDVGHIVAKSKEDAEKIVKREIDPDNSYMATSVSEVEVEGYEITVKEKDK